MTARYLGMNRSDGLTVTDLEHISQSIGDILRTPVGSRVMRRDYGSLLASMLDQPQTPALELQIKVACYMAVLKWEPGTFRIVVGVLEQGITEEMYQELERLVADAKPASRWGC